MNEAVNIFYFHMIQILLSLLKDKNNIIYLFKHNKTDVWH